MESLIEAKDKEMISKYGKLKGWDVCNSLGLQSFGDVYILRDYIDINNSKIRDIFGDELLLCRTDAPIGQGYKMIRGRDVKLDDINNYLKEVKKCTEDGVILMSKHPSTMLTGHYTPRYKTNGAIMVVFEKGDRILIDYVGPGFDVGDITRGKTVHTAIQIPWNSIYEKPIHNYKDAKMVWKGLFQINNAQYKVSRNNRINELVSNLKEQEVQEIEESIPQIHKICPHIYSALFQRVFSAFENLHK